MTTVTLKSIPYGVSVIVPRDRIFELYPDSVIATALNIDPTTEIIDIPSPDVTPNSLFALKQILDTKTLPEVKSEYEVAANYLGTDSLGLVGSPGFVRMRNTLEITPDAYLQLMHFSIDCDDPGAPLVG